MQVQVLIATDGNTERRVLELPANEITIGRGTECSVCLVSPLVSRLHATVELNGINMRVRDSSRNGTVAGSMFLNGSAGVAKMGDTLTIGEFVLTLFWGADAGQKAQSAEEVPVAIPDVVAPLDS